MCITLGFLGGSEDKASACNAGDPGSIPGLGRSPGEGNGNPLQYSCLENPMDRGIWRATVHGVAKSRTQLSDFIHTHTHTCITLGPHFSSASIWPAAQQSKDSRAVVSSSFCKAEFPRVSWDPGGCSSSPMSRIPCDRPHRRGEGLATWKCLLQSCFVTVYHGPLLCFAFHVFLPAAPHSLSPSLIEAQWQGTLLHVYESGIKAASTNVLYFNGNRLHSRLLWIPLRSLRCLPSLR